MQLRTARLCLDCEEIHDSQQCPSCASETFAFLTRWVPVPERQQKRPRTLEATSPETLDTYREMLHPGETGGGGWRALRRGALGLAIFGVAGWLWRQNARPKTGSTQTTDQEGQTRQRP